MSTPTATPLVLDLKAVAPAARDAAARDAAQRLVRGELVILPTETVYGVAANAASEPALRALARFHESAGRLSAPAPQPANRPFATWHAPTTSAVLDGLDITAPLHRRVLARLTPGPVRLLIEKPEADADRLTDALGVLHNVIENAGFISARIPSHAFTHDVLVRAGVPIILDRVSALGLAGPGNPGPGATADAARAAAGGVTLIVDDGPTVYSKPSTTIRLLADGSIDIREPAALDERYIRRQLERVVLFVCTGNTCRSPMAEAIAKSITGGADERTRVRTRILSAGTSASPGQPATAEALHALDELGISRPSHRARPLTRDLIAEAEIIYTMTASHRRAILNTDPDAAPKVHLLDPAGHDIPDPIGGPPDLYLKTAERLADAIRRRFNSLDHQVQHAG